MTIKTLEKTYSIIRQEEAEDGFREKADRFVCRDEADGNIYLLVRIRDKVWITHTMGFFVDSAANRKFTDFVDCFVAEDALHMVFAHKEEECLADRLERGVDSLAERLLLFLRILERMVLLDMPYYIQQDCLTPRQVLVTDSLGVYFRYELRDAGNYEGYGYADVREKLAELFSLIFANELAQKTLPPLEKFLAFLPDMEDESEIEDIYRRFEAVREEVLNIPPEEMTPGTLPFRIWDKIKQTVRSLRRVLIIIIIVVGIVFLVHLLRDTLSDTPDDAMVFEQIGTLKIRGAD